MEDRLDEGVEVGEDSAALGAEGVGLVEDRCDSALFVKRWQPEIKVVKVFVSQVIDVCTSCQSRDALSISRGLEIVREVGRVHAWTWPQNFEECAESPREVFKAATCFANDVDASARSSHYDVILAQSLLVADLCFGNVNQIVEQQSAILNIAGADHWYQSRAWLQ